MASHPEGSLLEICLGHKREQSQDSGAYIDWNSEDSGSPVSNSDTATNDDFITVVAVENDEEKVNKKKEEKSFVTILAIGNTDETSERRAPPDPEEEILIYRLPGERLGFGLKFEGGTNTAENVKRLFIQSSAPDSPASRAKCSWGALVEGDEILKIDDHIVKNMTRLDCVRCLKESSVVIKLYVRHTMHKRSQQSGRYKMENFTEIPVNNNSSSPTVISAKMKKNIPPPPPPVPPRKITKKTSISISSEPIMSPSDKLSEFQNGDLNEISNTIVFHNDNSEDATVAFPKHAAGFAKKIDQESRDTSKESNKHSGSELKLAPAEPKVYLDLLAQEESRNGESESDDTCSTVSTVVGLSSSIPTTNSSFSDLRSSASSFCDSTSPSTPTSEPNTPILEISRVLPPFHHLQNTEFLFSKLINDKNQDNVNYDEKSVCAEDIAPLQPPLNFQDAPLSFGNEEMRTNLTENLGLFQNKNSENSVKTEAEALGDNEMSQENGKSKDKTKENKKPSLIPRLAKSIGFLSPPKPSPRKEAKTQEGSKSRFHKKKPPPPLPSENSSSSIPENEGKTIKSSISYLKKKKNKSDDLKKSGKSEKLLGVEEPETKKQILSAKETPNFEEVLKRIDGSLSTSNPPEAPKFLEMEKEKSTLDESVSKNTIENNSESIEEVCQDSCGKKENFEISPALDGLPAPLSTTDAYSNEEIDVDADKGCESQYMFFWSGTKHLETIGEVEEDTTIEEILSRGSSPSRENDSRETEEEKRSEFINLDKVEEVTRRKSNFPKGKKASGSGEENLKNFGPEEGATSDPDSNGVSKGSVQEESEISKMNENKSKAEDKKSQIDESETSSKHPSALCGNHVLVKLDNDSLEVFQKAVDLNNSNGDLKKAMVPVVSTEIGLVESTSAFRMPPDGHEFPQKYSEKPSKPEPEPLAIMVKSSESDEVDAGLPPLPTSEPPSSMQRKYLSPILLGEGEDVVRSSRKPMSIEPMVLKPPRNSFWRQDEKSEKSVRDKIAMFSSVPDSTMPNPSPSTLGKLSKYKSSEDVFYSEEPECNRNNQNVKLFSKSVMTLDKVTGAGNPYAKKNSYGDSSMPPRSLDYSNRTQSSMDLSSSSSSAYSSSCSPDSSLSSNSSSYMGYSSTLPKKKTRNEDCKTGLDKKDAAIHRTTSFSVHGRSQSLLDVNPTSYRSRYLSETLQEDGIHKPGALDILIEQRRKNLTKLRGLVIPEKLRDPVPGEPIVDLPVIKSRDSILNSKIVNAYKKKSAPPKFLRSTFSEISEPKITPTHLWDMQNKTPNVPKYSPAFKRKSISVFGGKEPLSLNVKKEISASPLQGTIGSEPVKAPLKPPRNVPLVRQNSVSDDRKYQDALTSIICETEIDFPLDKSQHMNEIKSFESYVAKRKLTPQGRYRFHSDVGRSEEDSDNDSAVSSSRSSISHGFSPPASPLLGGSQYPGTEDTGRSSQLLQSPEGINSTKSSPSSNSFPGMSYESPSINDANNKRILKPQSVEAINRKNVLTSAKFSRGFDVKSGSPLIQRRFSKEVEENSVKNLDFSNTLNQALSSGRKFCQNGVDAKDMSPKEKLGKIAYITDMIEEPGGLSEKFGKKKVEKSESVPLAVGAREKSARKASVPSDRSWEINDGWNKSSEQVPINAKEISPLRSASCDSSSEERSTFANKDFSFNNLQSKNNITTCEKVVKSQIDSKGIREIAEGLTTSNMRSVSVNDIRRTFEKAETPVSSSLRPMKNGSFTSTTSPLNGMYGNHTRVSSLDSTTSDDGPYGCYSGNLLREQFGSITSLASSTSLISPQELQLLIEEANMTLEETANANGGPNSSNHDVLVIILHRDTMNGSIGITLAGGADYESKEITVHKVLAGSPADRDGRIRKGDRILSINGKSMKGITHRESLSILKSPRLEVVLVVSRLKTDGGSSDDATSLLLRPSYTMSSLSKTPKILEQETSVESNESIASDVVIENPPITLLLVKDGAGLGFSLEGGKDCSTGDRPLVVKKIFTGGVAEKCGQLKAGDELLDINGVDVTVMSRIEAWKLMKKLPDGNVTITFKPSNR